VGDITLLLVEMEDHFRSNGSRPLISMALQIH